jgi:hypothetical protein
LSKVLFLKTTFGSNNFENKIEVASSNREISGSVLANQNYLEFLPELRFFKSNWLYLNMGVGFAKIKSSGLMEGFYQVGSDVFYRTSNFPDFRGNYEYFVGHLGFNINIKDIGIILEYGFRISGFTEAKPETLGIGINKNSFKFGIRYRIR